MNNNFHTILDWILGQWSSFRQWLKEDPPTMVRIHRQDVYTSEQDIPSYMKGEEIKPKE